MGKLSLLKWKKVKRVTKNDFEGNLIKYYKIRDGWRYRVSNRGDIQKKGPKDEDWVTLKPTRDERGYFCIGILVEKGLKYKKKNTTTVRVHRLVAEAFLKKKKKFFGKPLVVNHKDGDKANNSLYNLEWVTRTDNIRHAVRNELAALGERHGVAVLKDEEVREICRMIEAGKSNKEIINTLKIPALNNKNLGAIRRHKSWKHISKNYDFSISDSQDRSKGSESFHAKRSEDMVRRVCELLEEGHSPVEVSREMNAPLITPNFASIVKSRKQWKHISKDYNF